MIKNLRIQIKLFFITSFTILIFSCKKNDSTILYEGFDFQKMELVLKSKSIYNWYAKGYYTNNSLNSVIFLNKKTNSILRKDSIYYLNKCRYFVNKSKFKYKTVNLEMVQITFYDGNSIQRHFLIKKSKKYYLSAVMKQINSINFGIKKVNKNSLEFYNILQYLKNIAKYEDKKKYFTDYGLINVFYKNNKMFYKIKHHFDWGISASQNYSSLKNNYGNLFLDLNNFEISCFFYDEFLPPCEH